MGGLAEQAIDRATEAIAPATASFVKWWLAGEPAINDAEREI